MNTDIISLRVLLVTPAPSLRGLLRQGVAQASVPAEVMEADGVAAATGGSASGMGARSLWTGDGGGFPNIRGLGWMSKSSFCR